MYEEKHSIKENENNHIQIENFPCFHRYLNFYAYQIEELLKMDGDFIIGVIFLHKNVNYIDTLELPYNSEQRF